MNGVTKDVLASCMESLLDAVFLVDTAGKLVYVSPACISILGYTPEEMIGRQMIDFLAEEDRERTIKESVLVMSGLPRIGFENRYVHKDGHYVDIMWSARWSAEHRLRIGVARDISARRQAEAMQRATYAISQAAHDAVDLSALSKGIHDTLASLFTIDAMILATCTGEPCEWQAIYRYCADPAVPALDWTRAQTMAMDAIQSRQAQWQRMSLPAGQEFAWMVMPMLTTQKTVGALMICSPAHTIESNATQQLLSFVCEQTALAIERRQLMDELHTAATLDELTGLPNRRSFREFAMAAVRRAEQERSKLAVLFVDIDGFKHVNDSFGHVVGDHLLRELADRMRRYMEDRGFVARLAGDEFVAVIQDATVIAKIAAIVQGLRKVMAKPLLLQGTDFRVRVSTGTAIYPDDAASLGELMQLADKRMYIDKSRTQRKAL
jgi:diguanylate cyclase (GGDEF)-like protein/PAS domain S-box-containing protein